VEGGEDDDGELEEEDVHEETEEAKPEEKLGD
jgi:hypothetical protein